MTYLYVKRMLLPGILLICIGLVFVIVVALISVSNSRNLSSVQESINVLSAPNSTIELLNNSNSELLVSENNFRIYLSTNDTIFRDKFLYYMKSAISNLESLQISADSINVTKILSGLDKKLELATIINNLKKIVDSVTNNFNTVNNHIINNRTPIALKKIKASLLKKYYVDKTDTLVSVTDRNFLSKKLGSLFSNKEGLKKGEGRNEVSNSTSNTTNSNEFNMLSDDMQRFYKKSLNKESDIRKKIANNEITFAQTNLTIIDDIDDAVQKLTEKEKQQNKNLNAIAAANATSANNSIKKQTWVSAALILIIAGMLIFSIKKIADKTEELDKNNIILKRNDDMRTRLISIISHDIVAPLKYLHIASKNIGLQKKIQSDELLHNSINSITGTSQQLGLLATNILNWIKYQNENRHLTKEKINLHCLINEVLDILKPLIIQDDVYLLNAADKDKTICQFSEPLKIVLHNLILNAIKFTRKGCISISNYDTAKTTVIVVKDEGAGMTEKQINNVMSDLYIVTSVNVDAEQGNGLGYLIIKDMLKTMAADIHIKSEKGKGTCISILFKK